MISLKLKRMSYAFLNGSQCVGQCCFFRQISNKVSSSFQGSHFLTRQIPWLFPDFLRVFPDFFLSFHQDILVKKHLFFLNVALVTLVYANIASFQLVQFPDSSWDLTVLKNVFLRFLGLKGLKMVWGKSSLIWNIFPWFWLKIPFFTLISLTGKSLQNFPWIP